MHKKRKVTVGNDVFGEAVTEDRDIVTPIKWKSHVYSLCGIEYTGMTPTQLPYLPMTREDCLRWLSRHGYPRPPRSSCLGCPFHSDAEWRKIRENPVEWADVVDFDRQIRDYDNSNGGDKKTFASLRGKCFLHTDRIPLDRVKFTDNDYPMFQCSDGICGV